jgi:small ligand-binding sensory domain FIST
MKQFMSIRSQHEDVSAVVDDTLRKLANIPPGANFGFLYVTDAMADEFGSLLRQCKSLTGIRHWTGTVGLGIISDDLELYEQPAASIMLARFPEESFAMLPLISEPRELDLLPSALQTFSTSFGLIHGDPLNPETQQLITGLQQRLENGFLVGGLSSSRDAHFQVADDLLNGGISGVVFSEEVGVLTNLTQGCSPVGAKHHITKSQENVAFTLDDNPALEVMMQDLGIEAFDALQQQAGNIFAGLCIAGSDKSDYRVRNLVGVDMDNKLFAINDYLTEGEELLFCTRSEESAEQDMRRMLEKLGSRLEGTPRGGVYVSCLGRGREQFPGESREVRMIHEALGDFPLTGFFANGEIHHDTLYGYTGVLTLFT